MGARMEMLVIADIPSDAIASAARNGIRSLAAKRLVKIFQIRKLKLARARLKAPLQNCLKRTQKHSKITMETIHLIPSNAKQSGSIATTVIARCC